jgi:hypothetical protein
MRILEFIPRLWGGGGFRSEKKESKCDRGWGWSPRKGLSASSDADDDGVVP